MFILESVLLLWLIYTKYNKMKTESIDREVIILPCTAMAITVTNVLTPHMIRIFERKDYEIQLNLINKKLIQLEKKGLFKVNMEHVEPKIGDAVIIREKLDKNIDLPAWLCRGLISNIINTTKNMYHVFLPDYGIAVKLHKSDFCFYSTDLIQEEYLTYTVGLYNVLPTALKSISQEKISLLILEEWDLLAIQYTKELMAASTMVYFDHLVSDKHGRQYGEFYLNIKGSLIRLSETLSLNNVATYLQKDMMKCIQNPSNHEKLETDVVNNEIVLYINISKECKKQNERNKQENRRNKFEAKEQLLNELRKGKEKVLIYGGVKYDPLYTISDLRFPAEIHKAFRSLVNSSSPKKIQSYILPAIKNGLDVIAIGAAQSGKTLAYGLAVCGLMVSKSNLSQGTKPVSLILCSSSSKVLEVHYMCTEFLQNSKTLRCVAVINGKSERSLAAEIYNGCQVLVSTPNCLARFIDQNKKLLNFKNLQYLILDDGDIILKKYFNSISQLLRKHKIICNRELRSISTTLQIIITAECWTPLLKKLANILMNCPYICIASFLEATIFKSVRLKMYIVNTKNKNNKIFDLLGDKFCTLRTVIVCKNSNEAKDLQTFLKLNNIDILLAHEEMNLVSLQGIKQCWDACVNGSYPVLICTDEVLSDLDVTNAVWLIHYSISLRFKTRFNFRFSTLFNSLQEKKSRCEVTIIVDENSDVQFLSLINLMQRMNVVVPQDMLEKIEHIRVTLEKRKQNYPLCSNVKLWGFCHNNPSCIMRHIIISEMDSPTLNIRINDKVKFRLVSIHNATQISARIISYIKFDTLEEIELSNVEYMTIIVKIQEFYSSVDNRRRCESVNMGDICGLEEPVDNYQRVEILNITTDNKTDKPTYADVRCIDNGVILKHVNVYRLLDMPEEFRKYPAQVVEVILAGIAPHDNEYVWNRCATDAVFQWFKDNVDDRSYIIGTVILHLKNTMWVDTLEVGTKLIGYKDIIGASLKAELLRNDHATENNHHLPLMCKLYKDAGLLEMNETDLNVLMHK
ncbi:putative ATP-dependent RNA helicase TDRD12 [Halictus rubicundus]|uniref:putative ATP-dependent RNA helicase TDRD12 n=1 Tax=Halictus rubicundus TaxID=77578 RepID=UPI00403675C2